jgi:hypothetical protein
MSDNLLVRVRDNLTTKYLQVKNVFQETPAYGLLASLTLLPIYQAFASGDFAAANVALGALLHGVSSDLLSNFMQEVFRPDSSPKEIADVIYERVKEDPKLLKVVDPVVENAQEAALSGMNDAQQQQLKAELQQQTRELGSSVTITGGDFNISGSTISGGHFSSGQQINTGGGAYFAGKVSAARDFISGDKTEYNFGGSGQPNAEKIQELQEKIEEAQRFQRTSGIDLSDKIAELEAEKNRLMGRR